jgi:hypothetical protein
MKPEGVEAYAPHVLDELRRRAGVGGDLVIAPLQASAAADREEVLGAMAEVMERQARVTRAEATLAAARRHLEESTVRLARLAPVRGEDVAPSSPAAAAVQLAEARPSVPEGYGTMRERIVVAREASPGEVFAPRASRRSSGPTTATRSGTHSSCSLRRA